MILTDLYDVFSRVKDSMFPEGNPVLALTISPFSIRFPVRMFSIIDYIYLVPLLVLSQYS
jgi:hypothetical protein